MFFFVGGGSKSTPDWGWRSDVTLQSTRCSRRGPRCGSQNPHGSLQMSTMEILKDVVPSSGLLRYKACMWCTCIHADKHYIHNTNDQIFNRAARIEIIDLTCPLRWDYVHLEWVEYSLLHRQVEKSSPTTCIVLGFFQVEAIVTISEKVKCL